MGKSLFVLLVSLVVLFVPTQHAIAQSDTGSEITESLPIAPPQKSTLKQINEYLFSVLFFDVSFGSIEIAAEDRNGRPVINEDTGLPAQKAIAVPLVVFVLAAGAVFFTLFYGFINLRGFKHSLEVIAGRYDKEEDAGEISHFRALTSALSATVGLGNIAGVAVAIQVGGPGAVFWMILMAFFGMSSKFSSCTLSQLFRKVAPDGSIAGGPMYYIDIGFRSIGAAWRVPGKCLAVLYACLVMGGAIGGGNMFQANQTAEAFRASFGWGQESAWYVGIVLAVAVAVVIVGGVKRIGYATSRIVPLMCAVYVLAALFVIARNIDNVPHALDTIVTLAFQGNSFFGGIVGVLITGVQRAAFSNEAGLGSAAIIHAAAKTDEPVREGLVAMIGPFIDTMVICLMTALVVIVTGTWDNPEITALGGNVGVAITSAAFETVIPWFPYVLTLSICLFAYSTMIAWCYYGERGWIYLFDHFGDMGSKTVLLFRLLFVSMILVGAVNSLSDVIDFTDAMILSMAIPNISAMVILAPIVRRRMKEYMQRLAAGEMRGGASSQ